MDYAAMMGMIEEKRELDDKLMKLTAYRDTSPEWAKLPTPERIRLQRQHKAMTEYSDVLSERIAAC